MALKEAYLKLGERNKCVKYRAGSAGVSDLDGLRAALEEAKLKDFDLKNRMEGCTVVFQRLKFKKSTQSSVLVDIDDSEEIEDECDLVAVFCPIVTSTVPVVISEGENNIIVQQDGTCTFEAFCEPSEDKCSKSSSGPPDNLKSPNVNLKVSQQSPKPASGYARKGRRDQKSALLSLPKLSQTLLALRGKANTCMEKFIAHYGFYLRTVTEDLVSKEDYKTFSQTIIKAHPEMGDPSNIDNPHHLVKEMLSQFVRNSRRRDRACMIAEDLPPAKKRPRNDVLLPSQNIVAETPAAAAQMEKLEEALKEIGDSGATTHVIRLAKETFERRRKWILSTSNCTPSMITEKYPHLKNSVMIGIEFSMIKDKDVSSLLYDLEESIQEVAKFKGFPTSSEREKAVFLRDLYLKLKPKNTAKGLPDCFSIHECGGEVAPHLISREGEGARLVMFLQDESLIAAFIVADNLTVQIDDNPTVCLCLFTLIAAYHSWDCTYPPAFKCVLNVFDVFGFGTITKDTNGAFKKFKQEFVRSKLQACKSSDS